MLVCNECGKEVINGWIMGFATAPDSQKVALCAEHNTPENRKKAMQIWQQLIQNAIRYHTPVEPPRTSQAEKNIAVQFISGGVVQYACTGFSVTGQQTLRIDHPDGKTTFIPMHLIQKYTLIPQEPPPQTAEEKPAS